jgi:hypothetical protein
MHWLTTSYTPFKHDDSQKRKVALRSVAASVRFAVRMRESNARSHLPEEYVFDAQPAERAAINAALVGVDEWGWDIEPLRVASGGRPLQTLGWHLLHKWGVVGSLKLDEEVVRNWLGFVENLYQDNEYHNSLHAADVLQAAHFLLARGGAAQFLPPLAVFALLVSAMIHDAGHDGLNNLYHQNALTDRALAFNDHSIQENFHCMTVFTSMAHDPRWPSGPPGRMTGGDESARSPAKRTCICTVTSKSGCH